MCVRKRHRHTVVTQQLADGVELHARLGESRSEMIPQIVPAKAYCDLGGGQQFSPGKFESCVDTSDTSFKDLPRQGGALDRLSRSECRVRAMWAAEPSRAKAAHKLMQ